MDEALGRVRLKLNHHNAMSVVLSVLGLISATSGLIFNGFILLVLLWEKRFHSPNHLLLLHLATSDTFLSLQVLVTSIVVPFISYSSQTFIYLQGVLWNTLPAVILWTVCGLSLDRYFTVCFPFSYGERVTRVRAGFWILISWILSLSLAVGPTFGLCFYQQDRFFPSMTCRQEHDSRQGISTTQSASQGVHASPETLVFASTVILSNLLIPSLIIVSTQLHILVIARSQHGRIMTSHNLTGCVSCTKGRKDNFKNTFPCPGINSMTNSSRGGVSLVSLLFCSLILLWMPRYLVLFVESLTGREATSFLTSTTNVLLTLVPSVNAYVYGVKSRFLRQTFKRLIQRYLYKHEASLEIERRISLRSHSSSRFSMTWHSLTHPSSLPANILVANARYRRRYSAPTLFTTHDNSYSPQRDANFVVRRFSVHSVSLSNNNYIQHHLNQPKDMEEHTGCLSVTITPLPSPPLTLSPPKTNEQYRPPIPIFKLTDHSMTKSRQVNDQLLVLRGNNLKSLLSPIEEVVNSSSVTDTSPFDLA